jgi:DNA-binding NtrC family response regulator
VPSLEQATWSAQDHLASLLSSGKGSARLMASTADEPSLAADEGLLSPSLFAAFQGALVRVPPLRERTRDIGPLARAFVEELRRLNGLPPIAIAGAALAALEAFAWPGNVRQLRSAIESALTLAQDGTLRVADLPEVVLGGAGTLEPGARADRRFRDAKRNVVEAFERAYLEDLLQRHGGNVTGAAEQSGMLRSALQRLLRKHDLHSADFRRRGGPDRHAS